MLDLRFDDGECTPEVINFNKKRNPEIRNPKSEIRKSEIRKSGPKSEIREIGNPEIMWAALHGGGRLRLRMYLNTYVRNAATSALPLHFRTITPFMSETEHTAVIFVHGLYGSSLNFRTIAKQLSAIFPRQPFFSVDLRNHGDSPHSFQMDYYNMAQDLEQFIKQHAGGKAIVCGHSLGGI